MDVIREIDTLKGRANQAQKRKIERCLKAVGEVRDTFKRGLKAVGRVWNKKVLRRGERLHVNSEKLVRKNKGGQQSHPKAWTLSGTIRLAFESIGPLPQQTARAEGCRRTISAVAAVAHAGLHHQMEQLRAVTEVAKHGQSSWFFVQRGLDATPLTVNFGSLANIVTPWARYWHKVSDDKSVPAKQRWESVTYAEYLQLAQGKGMHTPRVGMLEFLVQTAQVKRG